MFTGLVGGKGRITAMEPRGSETRLRVAPDFELKDVVLGESIAVNGACLTVESAGRDWFTAYASAETLQRTNLGRLRQGDLVNLERALALGDRLGGHLVSGHVDCLAKVESIDQAGESKRFRLSFPPALGPQVVEKGSVALDGISLTVNHCGSDFLEVNIIPKTQTATTMGGWGPGREVNMETDLIGKYVERMLAARLGLDPGDQQERTGGITEELLRRHGF